MKILIYGAGVIGTLYAALLSEAKYNVTLYARGTRLESLKNVGLLYSQRGRIKRANVNIISELEKKALYDFIFLPVRENQVHQALKELYNNISPNIVTMVNTLESYSNWEAICGKGRIIPAFPGAGGYFDGNILNAALTPRILQPTTFAEISGKKTKRLVQLATIFKCARIPYQIVKDMHIWLLCHLAMVVPTADAYYETEIPERAGIDKKIMLHTARQMKTNFSSLTDTGINLSPPPPKMNLFRFIPIPIFSIVLSSICELPIV